VGADGYLATLARWVRPHTLAHCQDVRDHARALAALFGVASEDAALAGLLHDCAKSLPGEACLSMAEAAGLEVFEAERQSPKVLHQRLGAHLAAREFGVEAPHILDAIRFHTTGHPDMGPLARCVLVADYTSPDRDFPGVQRLRQALQGSDPRPAFVRVLAFKRDYVKRKGLPEHPWAEGAYARWL